MMTLQELRESRAWSQQDLAKRLHVGINTYRRFEYGETEPTATLLHELAQIFGLTMDEMYEALPARRTHAADTPEAASKRWGIGYNRVKRLCSQGLVPGAYRERRWVIPVEAECPWMTAEEAVEALSALKAGQSLSQSLSDGQNAEIILENCRTAGFLDEQGLTAKGEEFLKAYSGKRIPDYVLRKGKWGV